MPVISCVGLKNDTASVATSVVSWDHRSNQFARGLEREKWKVEGEEAAEFGSCALLLLRIRASLVEY